jgi:hypothetical protein
MGQIKKSWKFLIILAILGGLYGSYPYIAARVVAGDSWQGVVPKFTEDSLHYMTRADSAVRSGVMENPYHVTSYTVPSLSLTFDDSIAGLPYIFFSPVAASALNTFARSALLACLLGVLLLWMGYSRLVIIVSWLILASGVFGFMIRAGQSQIMVPYFLLFFILLLRAWYRDRLGTTGKHDALLLGLCAGLTPYIYTFLFQVTAASLFVGVVFSFLFRRIRLTRSLLSSILVMAAFVIPYFVYFKGIMDLPAFGETMNLILGIRSHFPSPLLYFYGRWLVVIFAWAFLLWLAYRNKMSTGAKPLEGGIPTPSIEDVALTIAIVALATFGVMGSNIITGVDIAGPSHVNYFVYILLSLSLIVFIPPTVRVFSRSGFFVQKSLLLLCALLVFGKVAVIIPEVFTSPQIYRTNSVGPGSGLIEDSPQFIMPVLVALRSLRGEQVIAAPDPINSYIPLYTRKHILYHSFYGGIFSVGTVENVERSFVSKLGQPLTWEEVERATADATLVNVEITARNDLARKLCMITSTSPSCSTLIVAQPYTESGIIDQSAWFDYYQTAVRPHIVKYLHRFDVRQVVIDRRLPPPEFLRAQTPWYSDPYYAIYDIAQFTE